jgi:hypothetical protein
VNLKQTSEWRRGEAAVSAVSAWLLSGGFYVLPTDRIEMGGAPAFLGPDGYVTVPDILAAGPKSHLCWHEVKWKERCVKHQRTGTWRTGIDVGPWRHYLRVQERTGIPGMLTLVQLRSGPEQGPNPVIMTQSFDRLAACVHEHDGGGDVKVWWEVDDFIIRPLRLSDDLLRVEVLPSVVHPWERTSRVGVVPCWVPPREATGDDVLDLMSEDIE